ncbi:hypothetical protein Btru_077230 [Bulinus truncatus]|nr:hypothetical protein Btru_077230 [Bulinus truncatus]
MIQMLSYPESNQIMRYSRPWYLLPFVANLFLLFSVTQLINLIDNTVDEDTLFSLPSWILYFTLAVVGPTCLAICRLLSDPAIPLFIGSLFLASALFWTYFATGVLQIMIFSFVLGVGLSLSFQAIFITISPYFIKETIKTSIAALVMSTLVMVVTFPLMNFALQTLDSKIFLYLSPCTFVASLIPFQIYLCSYNKTKADGTVIKDKELSQEISIETPPLPSSIKKEENLKGNYFVVFTDCLKNMFCSEGWTTSVVSIFVWLSWGAAADTPWMSMGWRYQYFHSPSSLFALQLFLCFVLFGIKILHEIFQPSVAHCCSNLANNYLQLGLLGISGILLCLIPEHIHQFHSHLLFTVGLVQQYDDLTDLYLLPRNDSSIHTNQYLLVKYKLNFVAKEGEEKFCTLCNVFFLICHLFSLLLMSCLAMILGIQVANLLGYVTTLLPLNYLFSHGGLQREGGHQIMTHSDGLVKK